MKADTAILAGLKSDGVALVPNVVSRGEAYAMRPLLEHAVHEEINRWGKTPGYVDRWMVHNLMMHGDPFLGLLDNPVIHAYLSEVLSDTCILYAYTSSSMPRKESEPGG